MTDESEFTDDERKRLRQLLQDDDRLTWARKQLRIFTPVVVAVAVTVWGFIDWLQKHWK